jgi:hypothetical protein
MIKRFFTSLLESMIAVRQKQVDAIIARQGYRGFM